MRARGLPPGHTAAYALALAPATVLFAILVAHSILETARDALFLSKLEARQLALAYVAMAGCAIGAIFVARRSVRLRDPRRALVAFLGAASVGTGVLAALVAYSNALVFVLYVWTGFVATLVVPSFWVAIDRAFAIAEAKRVFGAIGAGGVLGAMTGSAIAGVIGRYAPPTRLVWFGALAFAAAMAAASMLVPRRHAAEPPMRAARVTARSRSSRRYVRVLVALGALGMVALTLGDLTFKLVVANRVAARDLATWFGSTYAALNAIALVIQVIVTPRLLGRWGLGAVLGVLPVIILASSLGFAVTGAMIAVLALKLGDGGLRHSLHRVASEILYVPVPAAVRDGGKLVADALAQRGGQAIAAAFAGTIVFLGGTIGEVAVATAIAAAAWLTAVVLARRAYVAELRDSLQAGEIQRDVAIPELDAQSAALLERAIASDDELEAIAALDLLARRGPVPVAALRDPREPVVRHALSLLRGPVPASHAAALAQLANHPEPRIRAAALAARVATGCGAEQLVHARGDESPEVRAMALAHLAHHAEHAREALAEIATLSHGRREDRLAVVEAIGVVPHPKLAAILQGVVESGDVELQRAALRALERAPQLADVRRLVPLLASRALRHDVRGVLAAVGDRAIEPLVTALDDPETPPAVRVHLPRTLGAFARPRATRALSARLVHEPDERTADKLLRALTRLRGRDPSLAVDQHALHEYLERMLHRAARYAQLGADAASLAESRTNSLIREILRDKEELAVERSLRALGVLVPEARSVERALASTDPARFAAAHELVELLAPRDLRPILVRVLDGVPAGAPHREHEELIAALLDDPSESLRCAAALHVAEDRLVELGETLRELRPADTAPLVAQAFDDALARLHG